MKVAFCSIMLVFSALLPSCRSVQEPTPTTAPVGIDSVSVTRAVSLPDPIQFEVWGTFMEGCWSFYHFEKQIQGYQIEITPIGMRPQGPCTQILIPYQASDTIKVTASGSYGVTFHGTTRDFVEVVTVQ